MSESGINELLSETVKVVNIDLEGFADELEQQGVEVVQIDWTPLDICVAYSQGEITYLLVQAMENALREVSNSRHVACLLTQVEVDTDDPAFKDPSKSIGTFYESLTLAEY